MYGDNKVTYFNNHLDYNNNRNPVNSSDSAAQTLVNTEESEISSSDNLVNEQVIVQSDVNLGVKNLENKFKPTVHISERIFLSIPARSEKVFEVPCRVDEPNSEFYLCASKEITDGVYLAQSITPVRKNNYCFIGIMNTQEYQVDLNISPIELESLYKTFVSKDENNKYIFNINSGNSKVQQGDRFQKLINSMRLDHLNSEERKEILDKIYSFSDIFHLEGEKLTCTDAVTHKIPLISNVPPVNVRQYRLPISQRAEIESQINKMLNDGIIVESKSPYNSPLLVVPKKPDSDGTVRWRVVVDFRKLNDDTIGCSYPLPNITDILDQLGNSKYYSKLDLSNAYHQIKMDPSDQHKTAFSHQYSHYEYSRMPFGLKSAGASFQKLMNTVLTGIQGIKAFVYLDDIVIYSHDLKTHMLKIEEVFLRLRKYNLKLSPSKCDLLRKEISYLGHKITDKGIKPDESLTSVVKNFPIPKSQKDVKSFLGLASYYRRFIDNFSKIAGPMTSLLKKDIVFQWSERCQISFDELKSKLINPPILQYPNFSEPFILTTDASGYAIGSVLSQGKIGEDLPIAYASRTLNKAEINYSTCEKELLSIVWSVNHFRPYLFGTKFYVQSDNKALIYLKNIKDPNSRLTRFRLKLSEYDFEVAYKPGRLNKCADTLSRMKHEEIVINESKREIYRNYLEFSSRNSTDNKNVIDINGDLFDAPKSFSLAHCVSTDLKMEAGIAVKFKEKFGNVEYLKSQNPKLFSICHIKDDNRFILYLVTKNYVSEKPSYEDMFNTLLELRNFCVDKRINKLAIPKIGCGLDKLNFRKVREMVCYIFRDTDICIQIYRLEKKKEIIKNCNVNIIQNNRSDYELFCNYANDRIIMPINNLQEFDEHILESPNDSNICIELNENLDLNDNDKQIINKLKCFNSFTNAIVSAGQVCAINTHTRNIKLYLLISERNTQGRISYENVFNILSKLKEQLIQDNIVKISISKLGDNLKWHKVRMMFRYLFKDTNIDVLMYHNKVHVDNLTEDEKQTIIKEYHVTPTAGHPGINRMYKKLRLKYNWKNLKSDVKRFVKKCEFCQKNKSVNKKVKAPLQITDTPNSAFEKCYFDCVGPLPISENGYRFLLTCQDSLTKYLIAIPLVNIEAATIATSFVTDIICKYGLMNTLVTDQGTNFMSDLFKNVCKLFKVTKINCTSYHPESNSVERAHRVLGEYLRNFVDKNKTNWCTLIPFFLFSYNTTPHSTTQFSPFELLFGKQPNLPTSITKTPEFRYYYDDYLSDLKYKLQYCQNVAKENLVKGKEKSKSLYDKKAADINYNVGDKVLLFDEAAKQNKSKKLYARYTGPYEIISVDSDVNCTILVGKRTIKVHKNRIKLFHE